MPTLSADEPSHWEKLHMGYQVDRVDRSKSYGDHGKHINMVVNFVSRARGMIEGYHHYVRPQQQYQSANPAA